MAHFNPNNPQYASVRACGQDTLRIDMLYSDTSCKFDETEVQSIFNSGCLLREKGYIVYSTYFPPVFLLSNKQRIPKKYIIHTYQLE